MIKKSIKLTGDIIITDPCYLFKEPYIPNSIKCIDEDTIYGDWGCTVFRCKRSNPFNILNKIVDKTLSKKQESELIPIGQFCADSGRVCVCKLEDLDKYTGIENYVDSIKLPKHCYTVITDFDGEVSYCVINNTAYIVGDGNIKFFTCQTSL